MHACDNTVSLHGRNGSFCCNLPRRIKSAQNLDGKCASAQQRQQNFESAFVAKLNVSTAKAFF